MLADIIAILGIVAIAIGLLLTRRAASNSPPTGKLLLGAGGVAFALGLVLNFVE